MSDEGTGDGSWIAAVRGGGRCRRCDGRVDVVFTPGGPPPPAPDRWEHLRSIDCLRVLAEGRGDVAVYDLRAGDRPATVWESPPARLRTDPQPRGG